MTTIICDIDPSFPGRGSVRVGDTTYLVALVRREQDTYRIWLQRHAYGEQWIRVPAAEVVFLPRHGLERGANPEVV